MVSPISSVGSINSISSAATQPSGAVSPTGGDSGSSFTSMLSKVMGETVNAIGAGETAAIQGIQGSLAPYKVVESIMSAQRTLQTVLAVRDKVVSAYQDISRMSI